MVNDMHARVLISGGLGCVCVCGGGGESGQGGNPNMGHDNHYV